MTPEGALLSFRPSRTMTLRYLKGRLLLRTALLRPWTNGGLPFCSWLRRELRWCHVRRTDAATALMGVPTPPKMERRSAVTSWYIHQPKEGIPCKSETRREIRVCCGEGPLRDFQVRTHERAFAFRVVESAVEDQRRVGAICASSHLNECFKAHCAHAASRVERSCV